jgi:methanogenic corrinoid protein MtbC1
MRCDAALVAGDRRAASKIVDDALDAGSDLRGVYLDMLQPAMREIGRLWQENELTVAEEHVATAITQSVMARVFDRVYTWRDERTPTLIAACADDERHQMGLRMLCDLLELDGWETTYLGASVPIESLVELIQKQCPQVVALSATIAPHLPRVRDAIAAIRASGVTPMPVIIIGGRAVAADPTMAHRLGADLFAGDASDAVTQLNERVHRSA